MLGQTLFSVLAIADCLVVSGVAFGKDRQSGPSTKIMMREMFSAGRAAPECRVRGIW
jgi:hypothetical protein